MAEGKKDKRNKKKDIKKLHTKNLRSSNTNVTNRWGELR
jgi:hypothetical protein